MKVKGIRGGRGRTAAAEERRKEAAAFLLLGGRCLRGADGLALERRILLIWEQEDEVGEIE